MAGLDPRELYEYLCARAREGLPVTERQVVAHFGVQLGTVRKRFGLLAGNLLLEETGAKGEYDCSAVPRCTSEEFASAGSQGKGNRHYVRGLKAEIARLRSRNEVLEKELASAKARLREAGSKE
jgi:hypothetical protein